MVTITQLPPDILGKCNSYVEASKVATGELLLFTDGDVLLHELVLKITVNYMLRNSLDHLTISPQFLQRNPGIAISSVLAYCSSTKSAHTYLIRNQQDLQSPKNLGKIQTFLPPPL